MKNNLTEGEKQTILSLSQNTSIKDIARKINRGYYRVKEYMDEQGLEGYRAPQHHGPAVARYRNATLTRFSMKNFEKGHIKLIK